jgi:hypothetical protein
MRRNYLKLTVAALAIVGSVNRTTAQDLILDSFDTSTGGWARDWGVSGSAVFDPAVDADGNPNSGSLYLTMDWANTTGWQDIQFTDWGLNQDFSTYTKIVFDAKVDVASSYLGSKGNYGASEFIRRNGWKEYGYVTIANTNGWVTYEKSLVDPGSVSGLTLRFASSGTATVTNTVKMWVDNIRLVPVPQAPMPVSLKPVQPGLAIYATGGQYQRQNIRTAAGSYVWAGATEPVTYALTIADMPGASFPTFEANLLLVGNDPSPGGYPDYNPSNVVYLQIYTAANGTYSGTARFKTNQPAASGQYWDGQHQLAVVGTATPVGTWSLTFNPDSTVVLKAPDGATNSGVFPADALPYFANGVYAYFGINPNTADAGLPAATFTRFQVIGGPSPLDDSFADLSNWNIAVAAATSGVQLRPADTVFQINWLGPAIGYNLEQSTDLAPFSWVDSVGMGVPAPVSVANQKMTFIPASTMPGSNGFYRLIKY